MHFGDKEANVTSFTLSEMSAIAGQKPRTLQFWTTSGVIIPEEGTKHGGPGVHRRYQPYEVAIACICSELIKYNFQIGTILEVANAIRAAAQIVVKYNLTSNNLMSFLWKAAAREIDIDDIETKQLQLYFAVVGGTVGDQDARLYIYKDNGAIVVVPSIFGKEDAEEPSCSSYIALNLSHILPKSIVFP